MADAINPDFYQWLQRFLGSIAPMQTGSGYGSGYGGGFPSISGGLTKQLGPGYSGGFPLVSGGSITRQFYGNKPYGGSPWIR
jgi:hypothetical protein